MPFQTRNQYGHVNVSDKTAIRNACVIGSINPSAVSGGLIVSSAQEEWLSERLMVQSVTKLIVSSAQEVSLCDASRSEGLWIEMVSYLMPSTEWWTGSKQIQIWWTEVIKETGTKNVSALISDTVVNHVSSSRVPVYKRDSPEI